MVKITTTNSSYYCEENDFSFISNYILQLKEYYSSENIKVSRYFTITGEYLISSNTHFRHRFKIINKVIEIPIFKIESIKHDIDYPFQTDYTLYSSNTHAWLTEPKGKRSEKDIEKAAFEKFINKNNDEVVDKIIDMFLKSTYYKWRALLLRKKMKKREEIKKSILSLKDTTIVIKIFKFFEEDK